MADPATSPVDQAGLPRFEFTEVKECAPRSDADETETCSDFERYSVRESGQAVLASDDELGVGPLTVATSAADVQVWDRPEDSIADIESGDALTDHFDDTCHVGSGDEREFIPPEPLPPQRVARIDADGTSLDEYFVGIRRELLYIFEFEDARVTKLVVPNGTHMCRQTANGLSVTCPEVAVNTDDPPFDQRLPLVAGDIRSIISNGRLCGIGRIPSREADS